MQVPPRATPLTLLALVALLATIASVASARADGGVPIPAPAGSTWSIVAGYNTGTHSEADGQDPHAIDLIRTDDSTDWTPVLAPVDGIVTWSDHNCLTIRDAYAYAHLLCHLAPRQSVARGLTVSVGDELGHVFPAGYDANGGIAHIHYAIHHTSGGGRLGPSVPFIANYAIEGRELPYANQYNLHAGAEFTSTNSRNWTPPRSTPDADAAPPQDEPAPHTGPHSATTIRAQPHSHAGATPTPTPDDAPVGGWRAVGVHERTSVAGLFANLQSPLLALVVHNPFFDTYHRFDPADETSARIAVQALQPGQAVWAQVQANAPWLPPPANPSAATISIALTAGANMVSWQGPDRDPAQALANVDQLVRAYRYDPRSKSWRLYDPAAPAFLNTLDTLRAGDAFHLVVGADSVWTQLP